MTAPVRRPSVPSAVGENRERIRILEAVPQPIVMREPHQRGSVVPAIRLKKGLGVLAAPLVLPDNTFGSVPWGAGEIIRIDWNHVSWYSINRAARIHLVTGGVLDASTYDHSVPWRSAPYLGGVATGGALPSALPSASYNGLYCLIGATDDDGTSLTWTGSGGLVLSQVEQFSFDASGLNTGHVGYAFVNIVGTGVITMTSTGAPTTSWWGLQKIGVTSGTPDFSTLVGDTTASGSLQEIDVTLTGDIPAGSQIVPVAFFTPPGVGIVNYDPSVFGGLAMEWPLITNLTRQTEVERVPYYVASSDTYGTNYFPVDGHIGGAGDIDTT